MFSEVIKGS